METSTTLDKFVEIITANDVDVFKKEFEKIGNNPYFLLKENEKWRSLDEMREYFENIASTSIITKASCNVVELIARIGSSEIMKFILPYLENFGYVPKGSDYCIMHILCKYDHLELLKHLLSAREHDNFKKYTSKYCSLLSVAINYNRVNIAKYLVESGHEVQEYFGDESIIWFALSDDKIELLEMLLSKGVHPNTYLDVTNEYPIITAYARNQFEVVKMLIKYGASLGNSTERDETILKFSIERGDLAMFTYLLENNIEKSDAFDRYYDIISNSNVFEFLMKNKRYDMMKILIEKKQGKYKMPIEIFSRLIDLCINCKNDIESHNFDNNDIESKYKVLYEKMLELIDLILKYNVFDPKCVPSPEDDVSPLLKVIECKNAELEQILLSHGAKIFYTVNGWINSLHLTALHNYPNAMLRILQEHPEAVNEVTIKNMTALHFAALCKNTDTMEILKDHGADPATHDIYGKTPNDVLESDSYNNIIKMISEENYNVLRNQAKKRNEYVPNLDILAEIHNKKNREPIIFDTSPYYQPKNDVENIFELLSRYEDKNDRNIRNDEDDEDNEDDESYESDESYEDDEYNEDNEDNEYNGPAYSCAFRK